ncbi:MAG: hypothetical protein LBU97_02750 [Alistipes sp.]|jgi:hypothetical protein|nr:hypothetical protein [Alistipes sp.]
MKLRILAISAVAALATTLTGCMNDPYTPWEGDGELVTVSLNPMIQGSAAPRNTRADYHDGDELEPGDGAPGSPAVGSALDSHISNVRILIYDARSKRLAFNLPFTAGSGGSVTVPIEVEMLTGTYDFVFIANGNVGGPWSPAPSPLETMLSDNRNVDPIARLDDLIQDARAYSPGFDIPMYEIARGVEVVGHNQIVLPPDAAGRMNGGVWETPITRTGVRLSFEITLTPDQLEMWDDESLSIDRVPVDVHMKPSASNYASAREASPRIYTSTESGVPVAGFDGYYTANYDPVETTKIVDYTLRFDRIILPELLFKDKTDADEAYEVSMSFNGTVLKGIVSAPDPATSAMGYTLPRNTWLHSNVTVRATSLEVVPVVLPWNSGSWSEIEVEGRYYIKVDQNPLIVTGSGTPQKLRAETNYNLTTEGFPAGITIAPTETTYIDGNGWIEGITIIDATDPLKPVIEVDADINTTGAIRRARINIHAGRMVKEVIVEQQLASVYAAPGVLGFVASGPNYGELTLRGSREFGANPEITAAALEMFPGYGLHEETVYAAFFKFGSLVVLSGFDTTFSGKEVIAGPEEYDLDNLRDNIIGDKTAAEAWGSASSPTIPYRSGTEAMNKGWKLDPENGLGDPCAYYFGGKWHLPSGNPWFQEGRTPFGNAAFDNLPNWVLTSGDGAGAAWIDNTVNRFNTIPVSGAVGSSGFALPDWGMYLPAAGARSDSNGALGNRYALGYYWSATPSDNSTGSNMIFSREMLKPSNRLDYGGGYNVRCVQTPPLPKGVPAPPGILGYVSDGIDMGKITLRGSSEFEGTPLEDVANELFPGKGLYDVPVYEVRFKFGSLVAYSSRGWELTAAANDGVYVTPNDIMAAPSIEEGYPLGLEGLRAVAPTFKNGGGVSIDQNALPLANRPPNNYYYNDSYPTWFDNMTEAWGDPCKFYSDRAGEGSWRIPTMNEWYDGKKSSDYNVNPADDYVDSRWIEPNLPEYQNFPIGGAVVLDNAGNPIWPLFVPIWYEMVHGTMGGQLAGGYWVANSLHSSVAVYGGNSLKGPDAGLYGASDTYLKDIRPIRCISPFFVNPTSLEFEGTDNTLAEAKSVTITTDGSWSISSKSNWLDVDVTSGTGNATVGIYPNESYQFDPANPDTPRAGFVTFTSATGTKRTVTVTQKQVPPPNPRFMLASPGVIGIKDSDYRRLTAARTAAGNQALLLSDIKLTIQGSSTFKDYAQFTNATTDAKYGPLEDEPVYMVNFLWGSLFGRLLSNDPLDGIGDAWSTDGSDIVWKNAQHTGSTAVPWDTVRLNWGSKTNVGTNTANEGKLTLPNLTAGHGDPCNYVGDGAWHTPTSREWLDLLGGPGTAATKEFSTEDGNYKWTSRNLQTGFPVYATFPQCLEWPNFSLPRAMWNGDDGKTRNYDDYEYIMYQTTTQLVANNPPWVEVSAALYLAPTEATTKYGKHSFPGYFLPVRCFRN